MNIFQIQNAHCACSFRLDPYNGLNLSQSPHSKSVCWSFIGMTCHIDYEAYGPLLRDIICDLTALRLDICDPGPQNQSGPFFENEIYASFES